MDRQRGTATRPPAQRNPWERFGWLLAAVWLVFLIYPIIDLLQHRAEPAWEAVAWLAMAAFVALYLAGFRLGMCRSSMAAAPSAGVWGCFVGLIVCAAVSVPALGYNAMSYLPFVMSFASYGLTRAAHWITCAGAVLLVVVLSLLSGQFVEYISLVLIVTLLAAVNTVSTFLIRRSEQAESLAIDLATSEEREAVARDVHDLIGHSLTVVKLKAQLARRLVDLDPERAKTELEELERIAGEAIQGVRATVTGLRSEGFAPQIESSRAALATAGVAFEVVGDPSALSPAQSLPAGWILREATTNILRHAGASRTRLSVRPGHLVVEDDGTGPGGKPGNGLRGMVERAAVAGAVCEVGVSEWGGMKVEVTW